MLPIAILAGGLASRLHPLTHRVPKALLSVAGRPFIFHQLDLLKGAGFDRVELLGDGRAGKVACGFALEHQRAAVPGVAIEKVECGWLGVLRVEEDDGGKSMAVDDRPVLRVELQRAIVD